MKIDGKKIALDIYDNLKNRAEKLKKQGINPHLAVILIGENPASKSYVIQKEKWSEYIGALFSLIQYPSDVTQAEILHKVELLNSDSTIHGIIIQRPVPEHIDKQKIIEVINAQKDLDGFRVDSPYEVPVALAVLRVLEEIYYSPTTGSSKSRLTDSRSNTKLLNWLKTKTIIVLGRGETAGRPIINLLKKIGINHQIITSKSSNPNLIIRKADIIITAVGKAGIIKPENIKRGAIVLGVGIFKGDDEKLHGDYVSLNIKEKASYYTPVTGGIGPVNVAYLLTNLITAAEKRAGSVTNSNPLTR